MDAPMALRRYRLATYGIRFDTTVPPARRCYGSRSFEFHDLHTPTAAVMADIGCLDVRRIG